MDSINRALNFLKKKKKNGSLLSGVSDAQRYFDLQHVQDNSGVIQFFCFFLNWLLLESAHRITKLTKTRAPGVHVEYTSEVISTLDNSTYDLKHFQVILEVIRGTCLEIIMP